MTVNNKSYIMQITHCKSEKLREYQMIPARLTSDTSDMAHKKFLQAQLTKI